MTKEFTGGEVTQRIVKHQFDQEYIDLSSDTIAEELIQSISNGDLNIYFNHCTSSLMGSPGIDESDLKTLEIIKQEMIDLMSTRRSAIEKVTFKDVHGYAKKIHLLHLKTSKTKLM